MNVSEALREFILESEAAGRSQATKKPLNMGGFLFAELTAIFALWLLAGRITIHRCGERGNNQQDNDSHSDNDPCMVD